MAQLSQRCWRVAMRQQFNSRHAQVRWISQKVLEKRKKAEITWAERAEMVKRGEVQNLWDIFEERGMVKDIAGESKESIRELMRVKRIGAYVGVDPTAPSLHIGHLLPLMPLYMMYIHGYKAVTLVGGATARIGDPIGRLESRKELSATEAGQNYVKIHYQLKKLWTHVEERAAHYGYTLEWEHKRGLHTNGAWWNKQPLLEVLKRLGQFVRMGPMLSRESVKRRMTEGDGMSFAEFTYPLMQAWDWWKLYDQQEIQMQIGGSDQLGNILTGREAVKFIIDSEPNPSFKYPSSPHYEPVGFTTPLLTDSSGAKFGKSAGNAIWLDEFKTSPFDLYGYFVRRPDDEIEKLLKLFTFIPTAQIADLMAKSDVDRSKRLAHHRLAYEVLCLVHGVGIAHNTQLEHHQMYSGGATPSMDVRPGADAEAHALAHNKHTLTNTPGREVQLPRSLLFGDKPISIARIVFAAGLADTKTAAQRLLTHGGLYIAARPGQSSAKQWGMLPHNLNYTSMKIWFPEDTKNFVLGEEGHEYLVIRKGKHRIVIVSLIDDEEYKAKGLTYPGMHGVGKFRKAIARLKEIEDAKNAAATGFEEDFEAAQLVDEEFEEIEDFEDEKSDTKEPKDKGEPKKHNKLDKW